MPRLEEIRELLKNMTKEERLLLIQMCNNENNKEENKDFYNNFTNNHTAITVAQTRFARTDMRVAISNLDAMPARKTTQSGQIQYGGTHTHKSIELWQ